MKCKHCGEEIDNDSLFCEFCGMRVIEKASDDSHNKHQLNIKKLLFYVILVGVLIIVFFISRFKSAECYSEPECVIEENVIPQEWVDLGLPSGTLWSNDNERGGFYTYDEAMSQFGNCLPTKEQFEELRNVCTWTWMGSYYEILGPNGQSITVPFSGMQFCDGSSDYEGSLGLYWSSDPYGMEDAWCFLCNNHSGELQMDHYTRCHGLSVRLVQNNDVEANTVSEEAAEEVVAE